MIYLAAPFFNEQQELLCHRLESAIAAAGYSVFSPRLECRVSPKATPEEAEAGFNTNKEAIRESEAVLAVMTYLLPDGRNGPYIQSDAGTIVGVLDQPDIGVVWELGFAHRHGVEHVWGYYETAPKAMNLMLSRGLDGYVVGQREVEEFLGVQEEGVNEEHLRHFTGVTI